MKHLSINDIPNAFPLISPAGNMIGYVDAIKSTDDQVTVTGWTAASEVGFLADEVRTSMEPKIERPDAIAAHPALSSPVRGDRLGFHISVKMPRGPLFFFLRDGSDTHYIYIRP